MNTRYFNLLTALIVVALTLPVSVKAFNVIRAREKSSVAFTNLISWSNKKGSLTIDNFCLGTWQGRLKKQKSGIRYDGKGELNFRIDERTIFHLNIDSTLAFNDLYQLGISYFKLYNPSVPNQNILISSTGIKPLVVTFKLPLKSKTDFKANLEGPVLLYPTGDKSFGLQYQSLLVPEILKKIKFNPLEECSKNQLLDPKLIKSFKDLKSFAKM